MTISTISTTITSSVTLGTSGYGAGLTITNTGAIITTDFFGTPIYEPASLAAATVTNFGTISDAGIKAAAEFRAPATLYNHGLMSGGYGVALAAGGTVINTGSLIGTGLGINMNGGSLFNSGVVLGSGGIGANNGAYIVNTGTVARSSTSTSYAKNVSLWNDSRLNNLGGTISSGNYAVYAELGSTIVNTGLITSTRGTVIIKDGSQLDNQGTIQGFIGVQLESNSGLTNSGTIIGQFEGVIPLASMTNDGVIEGVSEFGVVFSYATQTLINHGSIFGGAAGVHGTSPVYTQNAYIYNSGLIAGASVAIDLQGTINLALGAGARFSGAVTDEGGTGALTLAGTTAASLDMGGSFSGFSNVAFAPGADWTLEGTTAELAAHQTISGFSQDDTIVLDGFSATSESFVAGVGLVLSDGASSETLGITGAIAADGFNVTGTGGNTTIAPLISTIANFVSLSYQQPITLGAGGYSANLTITNTGTLGGSYVAAGITGSGTVTNAGTITNGVALTDGTVINTGTIGHGISLHSGLVVDSGSIANPVDGGYVLLTNVIVAQTSLTVVLEPGAQLEGGIKDEAGNGTLVLAGDNPDLIAFDTTYLNPLSGFDQISFTSGHHDLSVIVTDFSAGVTLHGFGGGDTLQLRYDYPFTDVSYVTGTGIVLTAADASTTTLAISGGAPAGGFIFETAHSGFEIDITAPCFCKGTRILTSRGKIAVESLAVGDMVKTATRSFQPIRWIGRRAYDGRFIAGNHLALPVKIRRHALGFNMPSRDLHVSPGHAICEGGVFVHAWRLVNGVSITQAERVERVEYFHIELDHHAVIFAENTPVESFLDNGCRTQFENAASATPPPPEQKPCLPLIEDGYYLARLKARIDARAGLVPPPAPGVLRGNLDHAGTMLWGWAQDEAAPEIPVELELVCGGQTILRFLANKFRADLRTAGLGSGCHAFELPRPPLPGTLTIRRATDNAVLGLARQMAA